MIWDREEDFVFTDLQKFNNSTFVVEKYDLVDEQKSKQRANGWA
jgi:hypothetical protein